MPSIGYFSGHFEALDWRPLQFVDLPSSISCDLCTVIPQNIFRLECYHSLCEGCYQSVLRTNRQCPLDKQEFLESEVDTLPIRATRLRKLEVRCCNISHGCNFVGSLERMKSHFLNDCEFHPLVCKKCCATVPRRDIISHYMDEQCRAQDSPREDVCIDSSVVVIGREINASLADIADKLNAVEDQLHNHTVGIDTTKEYVMNYAAALRTLQEGQSAASGTMSNVVAGIRTVTDALSSVGYQRDNQVECAQYVKNRVITIEETLTALAGFQKDVAKNVVSSGEGWKQCSEKLEAILKRVQDLSSSTEDKMCSIIDILPGPTGYGTNVGFFHVQGVKELKKKANEERAASTCSDVFALCGYSLKLSVKFGKPYDIMYIGVYLRICCGPKDSLLKWPFYLPCTLTLVHPTDDKKNIQCHFDMPKEFRNSPRCFRRPVASSNNGYGAPGLCKLEDALSGGFVYENSITVGVTLAQSSE
ncbi:TNF receptor-associated factor 6-B-like [Ornithodoros turicata]|uniref:TNF receptor-associated factor 6-B-like n=1 Tax=Ornithodoros turicata TaxID=34597 RepID=UPI00313A20D8